MSKLSQKDKEKADEILRLFSQLSDDAKPVVLGKLNTRPSGRMGQMEVKL